MKDFVYYILIFLYTYFLFQIPVSSVTHWIIYGVTILPAVWYLLKFIKWNFDPANYENEQSIQAIL